MKHFITILFFAFIAVCVTAQTIQKEQKVVQVMPSQTFYLNGGAKASVDGKSRVWYRISLPKNTVEWYYSITTSKNENSNTSLNLLAQLIKLYDPTGITAIVTSAILTPTGADVCDIYLMNRKNADAFKKKVDNWLGSYSYMISGSRENFKNGVVQIRDAVSGDWYLGFKNPSTWEGIYITFEVAAIVKDNAITDHSENEKKAEMFGNLGWEAYQRNEYDKCLELSKKALELNPNLGWVHNNIGLVQLIKKDYISAIDSYSDAIILFKQSDISQYWFNEAIKDLNALIAKHGRIEGTSDILRMLKNEMGR